MQRVDSKQEEEKGKKRDRKMGWAQGQKRLEGVHKYYKMTPQRKDQKYPAVLKATRDVLKKNILRAFYSGFYLTVFTYNCTIASYRKIIPKEGGSKNLFFFM